MSGPSDKKGNTGADTKASTTDLKLCLPKTAFSLKAGLPTLEPQILKDWQTHKVEETWAQNMRAADKTASPPPPYILHDGPPYANGHLHVGHVVNKVAKDVVVRFARGRGQNAPFVPGWDCHGLPIEAKVQEAFKKKGQSIKDIPVADFRAACKDFANGWVDTQRDEFLRLGVAGDFENPYKTLDHKAEATIQRALLDLLEKGLVYRGLKPVFWSPVEETALAEAEVEYKEVTSTSLYVAFPLDVPADSALHDTLHGAKALIWTTTPWTLPANRAIAFGDMDYVLVRFKPAAGNADKAPTFDLSTWFLLAKPCVQRVCEAANLQVADEKPIDPTQLKGLWAKGPLYDAGFAHRVPFVPAGHVSAGAGTGLVHTAPAYGVEDFSLAKPYDLEVADLLTPAGVFKPGTPLLDGVHLYKAADPVCKALEDAGNLFFRGSITHSYPHSWRSRTPLIYRATAQWFVAMDGDFDLRGKALKALEDVNFFPESGRARLKGMIQTRPDWCLSRQRTWGIPLMLFVGDDGQPLVDPKLNAALCALVAAKGVEIWFTDEPDALLAQFGHAPHTKVTDILDVWFESGASHLYALTDDQRPADVYLEGSDQHRGWFQSSLLISVALSGRAPFKNLVTHGFVVDEKGQKMSKSLGNVVAPQDIVADKGADVLRLWVLSTDLAADIRVGKQTFLGAADMYRRFRNTCRFLLGNLSGAFDPENGAPAAEPDLSDLPLLERWVLAKLYALDQQVMGHFQEFRFDLALGALHHFCAQDLSAFYLDVRKDALYCEAPDSPFRGHVVFVLGHVLERITFLLAPFIPFTAEQVFTTAMAEKSWRGTAAASIHLLTSPALPENWENPDALTQMNQLRFVRSVVTGALEKERAAGNIKSSLQAAAAIYISDQALRGLLNAYGAQNFADLCLVSDVIFAEGAPPASADKAFDEDGITVTLEKPSGAKCPRCWRFKAPLPSVDEGPDPDALCPRCDNVLQGKTDQGGHA